MIIYRNYAELVESPLFDSFIFSRLRNSYGTALLLLFLGGLFSSIFPFIALTIRPFITDRYVKRVFNWLTIFWAWNSGADVWFRIFLLIELVREFIRFGVPYLLRILARKIEPDGVFETLFRRLCLFIRKIGKADPMALFFEIYATITSFNNGDESGAFSEDEKQKFHKFFTDFSQTCFILDSEQQLFTAFFPSFVIGFSTEGIQMTTDNAIKLVRNDENIQEELCAICRRKLNEITVKLACNHYYCLNCIFIWMNREYSCPLCRKEIV